MIKPYLFFAIAVFCSLFGYSQSYKIDTLQYQGAGSNVINLVILGDGYTKSELGYFQDDARRFTDYFFKTEPFRQYANYFNVFAINTISKESGASHACTATDCPKVHYNQDDLPSRYNKFPSRIAVPAVSPNTIFGSSFDNAGIHRLVVPQHKKVIEQVLKTHIPNYTQVVILVNSPFYGGSGGEYATATVNQQSNDIAVHEIGHSFAGLADEYWAGNQYAYEGPNRTQEADSKTVKWNHWLGINGIGIYTYGGKDSKSKWFRPHEFCKMQYLVAPFCNVCQELFIETIHRKSNPIVGFSPASPKVLQATGVNKFSVKLLKPSPNTLQVKWYLNDLLLTSNIDSIYLNKGLLNKGMNTLRVVIKDTTDLVRRPGDGNPLYTNEWQIQADQLYDLDMPISTWGDTLETCYDSHQALSVKNPQAGVVYNWYDSEKAKRAIAVGANWVTPKLKKDRIYYLNASFGKKHTPKKPIIIKLLAAVDRPKNIDVTLVNGKYKITVDENLATNYYLIWYTAINKEMGGNKSKVSIEISANAAPDKIYLELVDKITTCKTEKFIIKLK